MAKTVAKKRGRRPGTKLASKNLKAMYAELKSLRREVKKLSVKVSKVLG